MNKIKVELTEDQYLTVMELVRYEVRDRRGALNEPYLKRIYTALVRAYDKALAKIS